MPTLEYPDADALEPDAVAAEAAAVEPGANFALTESSAADPDEGAMSAEYAIATIAAVTFAGVLIAIISSPEVRESLMAIIRHALSFG